jgi:hypothetical protein
MKVRTSWFAGGKRRGDHSEPLDQETCCSDAARRKGLSQRPLRRCPARGGVISRNRSLKECVALLCSLFDHCKRTGAQASSLASCPSQHCLRLMQLPVTPQFRQPLALPKSIGPQQASERSQRAPLRPVTATGRGPHRRRNRSYQAPPSGRRYRTLW